MKKKYHEDITIVEKKNEVLLREHRRIYANIELKKQVSLKLDTVETDDLVETLLYGLYYLQEGQAIDRIYSVLTDYNVWHIFLFQHDNGHLKLLKYYHFINTSTEDTLGYVCSFLNIIKETFNPLPTTPNHCNFNKNSCCIFLFITF